MKTFKLLLVMAFILSTGIGTASASTRGEVYGFIPLTLRSGSTIRLDEQTMDSFNSLAPVLLSAQRQGDIIEFEPDLSAGIVKVKYRAGFDIASMTSMPVYDNIHQAIKVIPFQEQGKREILSVGTPPVFDIKLYSSCFEAANLGGFTHLIGSLRDKTGRIVANYDGNANSQGNLSDCFDWTGSYTDAVSGYKVTFKRYSGSTFLGTYYTVLPKITFASVDKLAGIVSGKAPAGKAYLAYLSHPNLDLLNSYARIWLTGTVPGSGNWSANFHPVKIRGHDYLEFWVQQTPNFNIYRSMSVSHTYCILMGNTCSISGFPGQNASLTISHASTTYTFNGVFSSQGWFGVELLDGNNDPIFLAAGDKISGTGVTMYNMPKLTGIPQPTTDQVTGDAPADRYFEVSLRVPANKYWYSAWVHSSPLGKYVADFSGSLDITPNQILTIKVFYTDLGKGNHTEYKYSTGP